MKKKRARSVSETTQRIERGHPTIRIARQAELLGIARSSVSDTPRASSEEVRWTRRIDEIYTDFPFDGSRTTRAEFARRGVGMGRARPKTHAQEGLQALGPKPFTRRAHPAHKRYPSLLRGGLMGRVKQVWRTEMTDIRLTQGGLSLVAMMAWFRRYVGSWKGSIT